MRAGRLEPVAVAEFARFIMLWNELTSLVVTDGYRAAERDILARDAAARRGALQELLGVIAADAVVACPPPPGSDAPRPRPRPGVPPGRDRAASRGRSHAGTPGIGDEDLDVLAGRSATCWDRRPRARRASAPGSGCRRLCPCTGGSRSSRTRGMGGARRASRPRSTPSSVGSPHPLRRPRGRRDHETASVAAPQAWVAIGSAAIDGVVSLAETYADLVDATRTAQRLGVRGWIPDPERLAVERLLLADRELADAAVRRSWARSSPTSAWDPSSSRRSRRTSTRARTSPRPRVDCTSRRGRSPIAWSGSSPCSAIRSTEKPAVVCRRRCWSSGCRTPSRHRRRLSGCRRRRTRSAQHRRGTTEAQRGPRQFNG